MREDQHLGALAPHCFARPRRRAAAMRAEFRQDLRAQVVQAARDQKAERRS